MDFRYFPKGLQDVMETYTWSDNIELAVIKNETGATLEFNKVQIPVGETMIFTSDGVTQPKTAVLGYHPVPGEIFHVHTKRCGHAGEETDAEYVEKAIELGAPRIVFTDHAPFPGNPFGNRMTMEQLPEYLESMRRLKSEYRDRIEVLCGLEAEYLPSFLEYYRSLREKEGMDLLIIGQHFYEHEPGHYSFSDEDKSGEYIGLCNAMEEGAKTGLFEVIAHPDRAFRRRTSFGKEETAAAGKVIQAAVRNGLYLERNYSSMRRTHQYWDEFWKLLPPEAMTLYGCDAHAAQEMKKNPW
jgi:HisJ family histidinol phosphate phosphatase